MLVIYKNKFTFIKNLFAILAFSYCSFFLTKLSFSAASITVQTPMRFGTITPGTSGTSSMNSRGQGTNGAIAAGTFNSSSILVDAGKKAKNNPITEIAITNKVNITMGANTMVTDYTLDPPVPTALDGNGTAVIKVLGTVHMTSGQVIGDYNDGSYTLNVTY